MTVDQTEYGNSDRTGDNSRDRYRSRLAPGPLAGLLFVSVAVVALPFWLWWSGLRSSAAFGDSEAWENNYLGAATLDISVGEQTAGFRAENLAPGDAVAGRLQVSNVGSLPLRYRVSAKSEDGSLNLWFRLNLWVSGDTCELADSSGLLASGTGLSSTPSMLVGFPTVGDGETGLALAPGEEAVLCLGGSFPLDAPNEIQGQQLDFELIVQAEHDLEAGP